MSLEIKSECSHKLTQFNSDYNILMLKNTLSISNDSELSVRYNRLI